MPIRGSPNGPRHIRPHRSQTLAPCGHLGLERVVTFDWNERSPLIGTGGHHVPVRAVVAHVLEILTRLQRHDASCR